MKKILILILMFTFMALTGCESIVMKTTKETTTTESDIAEVSTTSADVLTEGTTTEDEYTTSKEIPDDVDEELIEVVSTREKRNLSTDAIYPANVRDTSVMWKVASTRMSTDGKNYIMNAGAYELVFKCSLGTYYPYISYNNEAMYQINNPVKLYIKGQGQVEYNYDAVEINEYGIIATANVTSSNGSVFLVEDQYYYPREKTVTNAINVQRLVKVLSASSSDTGFESIYSINTYDSDASNLEWYMPNQVYGSFDTSGANYKIIRETLMGMSFAIMRNATNGAAVSLARYKAVIESTSNSFACVELHSGSNSIGDSTSSLEICYPTRDSSRKYFKVSANSQIVYDMTIQFENTECYEDAQIDMYNNQYTLEDPRIVDTDIDEVYTVINEDFKTFMLSTTKNGYTSYGLPWRVTIENGKIGPKSYQSGFVGQQIPCAYNMMAYGIKNNDAVSLENGMNIINFWVNSAKMMTSAGVPMVWFNGDNNTWAGYPTFLRMAIDTMEGLLDAYRLAETYNLSTTNWYESIIACANWLVNAQNSDGSWYRCYNYQGTYYKGTESDIGWNPGDICRSTSKNNSTMPIRFLAKVYEMTGEIKYYKAAIKAGNFVYSNLYPTHAYYGGTCDNPDSLDKEAGVYAMYAYDTLYSLTGDEKWLKCLEQATVFTMSFVITFSYKIKSNCTTLLAANYAKYGYTDGLSFICAGGSAVDNYAAYMYYELFRVYILTGKKVYYKMAEFIQQNTKSSMDWDGVLGYAYKSLTPEASTIYNFTFGSATDDDGVQGVWLPWQSAANAEPIAKMYEVFGSADVASYKDTSITELRSILNNFGIGGKAHNKF